MFGEILKLARKKAGFSLRNLSEALDNRISAQAIGKYERGEMMPSSGVLLGLAKTLDVSIDYLMGARVHKLDDVEFHKKLGTSAKERARVEAAVIEHVERYLTVEEILDLDSAELHRLSTKERLTNGCLPDVRARLATRGARRTGRSQPEGDPRTPAPF